MANPGRVVPLGSKSFDEIDAMRSRAERIWWRVPLLGWMIAQSMWSRRTRPIRADLCNQLLERSDSASQLWGDDPERRRIAEFVCSVAKEQMGWPSDNFVPDDPFDIVFWSYEDGLDDVEAIMEIEDRVGIKLSDGAQSQLYKHTLGSFVEALGARLPAQT